MRRGRIAALALVVGVCAGCAGHAAPTPRFGTGWPSKTELRWLGKVGGWQAGVDAAARSFGLRAASADTLVRCTPALRTRVGAPPTPRLLPAYRDLLAACGRFGRLGREYRRSPGSVVVFSAYTDAAWRSLTRAGLLVASADHLAELGSDRPLPARTSARVGAASHRDPRLARAVEPIAGHPLTVRCWSGSAWRRLEDELDVLGVGRRDLVVLGRARIGSTILDLRGDQCAYAEQAVARGGRGPADRVAAWSQALKVLAHEAEHARGFEDEALTECYALQRVAATAGRLGIAAGPARNLARTTWADYRFMPRGYRTSLCADGGPLDLHPGSHVWP